jgi:hypothetical protein
MATFVTFDDSAAKKGDNNWHSLFRWFCCKESEGSNVVAFFYDGGGVKKTMATSYNHLLSFFLFLPL